MVEQVCWFPEPRVQFAKLHCTDARHDCDHSDQPETVCDKTKDCNHSVFEALKSLALLVCHYVRCHMSVMSVSNSTISELCDFDFWFVSSTYMSRILSVFCILWTMMDYGLWLWPMDHSTIRNWNIKLANGWLRSGEKDDQGGCEISRQHWWEIGPSPVHFCGHSTADGLCMQ